MIIVSHNAQYINDHCTRAAVLVKGELFILDTLKDAFDFYHESMAVVV